jgi:hypothetical protein
MQSNAIRVGDEIVRLLLLLTLAFMACTTKPNPGVCCTTDADCARLGIEPRGCPDGFACRALRCEAADCAAAADCSVEQPVCDPDLASCTGCTASSDCSVYGDTPVCDAVTGGCRACKVDAECASEVCDIDTGRCVSERDIIYASPGGADTAGCTHQQPCSVSRALVVASADPSSSLVRLLPGTYPTRLTFRSGVVEVVGTDASIRYGQPIEAYESAVAEIRGLDIAGDVMCAGSTNLFPSLTLRDSTLSGGAVIVNHGILRMLRSRVESGSINVGDDGTLEADRTYFDGSIYGPFYTRGHRMRVRITNSILDRIIFEMSNEDTFPDKSEYHVSFSTFVFDAQVLSCAPTNYQRTALFENNIFFSASPAITNVITGGGVCTFAGNITHPQVQPLGETNIVEDPRFVNVGGKDYRLQPGSPAVDAAVPSTGPGIDHDFAGTPRPQGSRKDIGAFELEI